MGVAAYYRGSDVVTRQIQADARPVEFMMMEELTNLPKFEYARKPFSDIIFVEGHGGWWAECPTTGKGYWYPKLRMAIRSWRVAIIGYDNGVWKAIPY